MNYEYLTPEDRIAIINQIKEMTPTPEQIVREAESNYWRAFVDATIAGTILPEYVAPDTTEALTRHNILETLRQEIK